MDRICVFLYFSLFSMRFLSADVVFPLHTPPVPGGVLVLDDDGRVLELLGPESAGPSLENVERFHGFLVPGFINAHVHLELSWALGKIAKGGGLDAFIRDLERMRNSLDPGLELQALATAGEMMLTTGTVAAGDIANTGITASFKERSLILFHTFSEVFASDPRKAPLALEKGLRVIEAFSSLQRNYRASLTPHAPYSVSSELLEMIRKQNAAGLLSIHHQESEDENTFFLQGTGPIAERRNRFNPGIPAFNPEGKRPLQAIAEGLGSDRHLVLVHNTFSMPEDVDFAESYFDQVSWCLCPNANLYIENKLPPLDLLRSKKVRILLGTDSLASNHSLSLLEELKTIHAHFPGVPLQESLGWVTRNAAETFGFTGLGSFATGKGPGVVLIEKVDTERMVLHPDSSSRLLVNTVQ